MRISDWSSDVCSSDLLVKQMCVVCVVHCRLLTMVMLFCSVWCDRSAEFDLQFVEQLVHGLASRYHRVLRCWHDLCVLPVALWLHDTHGTLLVGSNDQRSLVEH